MTEKTVKISITTEINAKTIKREISVDAGCLDSEMIKLKVDVIREAIIGGLEETIIKYEKEKQKVGRILGEKNTGLSQQSVR